MKILRIITRLNTGGPAIHATSLTKEFNNDECQTLLIFGKQGFYEGSMMYLLEGLKIGKQYLYLPMLQREIQWEMDLFAFKSLLKIIYRWRPDVIHTHTSKAGILGRMAGFIIKILFFRKIKLIHTYHGHVFHDYFLNWKTRLIITLERFLGIFTNKVIVLSEEQRRDICDIFRIVPNRKTEIIPLGFDFSNFDKYNNRRVFLKISIAIIGRLTEIKNHKMFLEGIKYLEELGTPCFKVIIGTGELQKELEDYAKELGLKNYVFMGEMSHEATLEFITYQDIVVQTSLNEGTPVALIEAMALGKPVISTDVGGVRSMGLVELFELYAYPRRKVATGIVIPVGKPEMLGRAIQWMVNNPERTREMGKMGRILVREKYNLNDLVMNLKRIYNNI